MDNGVPYQSSATYDLDVRVGFLFFLLSLQLILQPFNMNVFLVLLIFALIGHVTAAIPKFVFAHFIVSRRFPKSNPIINV